MSHTRKVTFKLKTEPVRELHFQSVHIDVGGEVKNYFHPNYYFLYF